MLDFVQVRRGIVRAQANWRMICAKREYLRLRQALAARKEQEKKSQEAEKERRSREDREREKRERATFQHLEIPAELGVLLAKVDG